MTGKITDLDQMPETDHRQNTPRFSGDNFEHNKNLVAQFAAYAENIGCTPGQLALAWLLAQGPDVVPIPGTKRRAYLVENAASADVSLSPAQAAEVGDLMSQVAGGRYGRAHSYGDSPARTTS
jgi:aryl-alcohol dehydrogenase-like predicted oxidoreductase